MCAFHCVRIYIYIYIYIINRTKVDQTNNNGSADGFLAISSPQIIESLLLENGGGKIINVCATGQRTCAISNTGDLYTWNTAEYAKQGPNGSLHQLQSLPTRVSGVKRAVDVAAGDDHTVILLGFSVPPLPLNDHITVADGDNEEINDEWNKMNLSQTEESETDYRSDEDEDLLEIPAFLRRQAN